MDLYIAGVDVDNSSGTGFVISTNIYENRVKFKDGICSIVAVGDHITAIHRTSYEQELKDAHDVEIHELKEEEKIEQEIERKLFCLEISALREKQQQLQNHNYEQAAQLVHEIIDLEEKNLKVGGGYCGAVFNGSSYFSKFPSSLYGIKFLTNRDVVPYDYIQYAKIYENTNYATGVNNSIEIDQIYIAAIKRFPLNAELYKEASLFWRRKRDFRRAIDYCEKAIHLGITDTTKTGFEGRINRLAREELRNVGSK